MADTAAQTFRKQARETATHPGKKTNRKLARAMAILKKKVEYHLDRIYSFSDQRRET